MTRQPHYQYIVTKKEHNTVLFINSDYNVHTEELNSIVLLLDDRLVEDDGVDAALLTGLCERTFVCP